MGLCTQRRSNLRAVTEQKLFILIKLVSFVIWEVKTYEYRSILFKLVFTYLNMKSVR
jgi:hypothetical protein